MLTALLSKPMTILIIVMMCLFFLWGISRNWKCNYVKPAKIITSDPYQVKRAINGVTLEIVSGIAGRKTRLVILDDVAGPSDAILSETSRALLEKSAGKYITSEHVKNGLFREEPEDLSSADLARSPIVGIIYNENQECLQIKQLELGMVKIQDGAVVPKAWKTAEKSAKKSKLGMWK